MSEARVDLAAIKARADAATEGPWAPDRNGVHNQRGECVALTYHANKHADAEFIAHARADVPALFAEVERLREVLSWTLTSSNVAAIHLAVEAAIADGLEKEKR
jgi:hypothetical protein